MPRLKLLFILALVIIIGLISYFDLTSFISLNQLKIQRDIIAFYYSMHPLIFIASFIAIYIVSTALSLPGAIILTLSGGAIFGPVLGTVLVAFSATIGATLSFLSSRFLFRDSLEVRFKDKVEKFNEGVNTGAFNYLLFLRLVPLFPFFLINLVLGLTRIPIRTYILGSFIGMIPGTFVYTNAGSQLSNINSVGEILSFNVLMAFVLLGLFSLIPVIHKKLTSKNVT
ncbi:TVP38/TMEM64 family protein [Candidatus Marinamargulisbacteria bacterium SCGC AAA071-K20]|nr:TVP38/TMEM64 family protein [Candidatus Marinamargulisbacteria bacterium SCGC AAA071-K20]